MQTRDGDDEKTRSSSVIFLIVHVSPDYYKIIHPSQEIFHSLRTYTGGRLFHKYKITVYLLQDEIGSYNA